MADKTLIIKRIKEAYSLRTNVEVARFLGVSAQVLSNWQNRNTVNYDTIFPKCVDLNLNWLINGEGDVFKDGKCSGSNDNVALDLASEAGESYEKKEEPNKDGICKTNVVKRSILAKSRKKKC